MHTTPASASARRRPAAATLTAGCAALFAASCVQPVTLMTSDAATVLAHRTISAPNPGDVGSLTFAKLYYGSAGNRRRPEFRDSTTYHTGTVDASPYAKM